MVSKNKTNKKQDKKDVLLDVSIAIGGTLFTFIFFFILGYFGYEAYQFGPINGFLVGLIILSYISKFRPYAGLYYALATLNIFLVVISIVYIKKPNLLENINSNWKKAFLKIFICLVILGVILIIMDVNLAKEKIGTPPNGFKVYNDKVMSIFYPKYMTPSDPVEQNKAFVYKVFRIEESTANFAVKFIDSEDLSLDEVIELMLESGDFKLISSEETTLLNNNAKKLIYYITINGVTIKTISILTVNEIDGIVIGLDYAAINEEEFEKYLPDVDIMMNSFQLNIRICSKWLCDPIYRLW